MERLKSPLNSMKIQITAPLMFFTAHQFARLMELLLEGNSVNMEKNRPSAKPQFMQVFSLLQPEGILLSLHVRGMELELVAYLF